MYKIIVITAISVVLGSSVIACSDDVEDSPEEGVLLPGDDDELAIDATYDLSVLPDFDPAYVSTEEYEGREVSFLRTELSVAFDDDATVGEVNDTLQRFDATIVDMVPRSLDFVVEVDDPGNMEGVRSLVSEFESADSVIEAMESDLVYPLGEDEAETHGQPLLPDGFDDGAGGVERMDHIDHQLAVRAHAAWNARSAIAPLDERPWLVVTDMFGHGAPDDGFNVVVDEPGDFAEEDDWNLGDKNRHGYHVLGIAAGAFEPVSGQSQKRDDVTGIFPETLRLRAVDMERKLTGARYVNRSGARVKAILEDDPDARVVLTSSIGEQWSRVGWRARGWTRTVRGGSSSAPNVGSGIENDFIHFTSAGNAERTNGGYDRWAARDNGPFAYAALGYMETVWGTHYPNLTNIHVVENRRNTDDTPPVVGCASVGSIMGGTLSAIGSTVHSVGECTKRNEDNACEATSGQDGAETTSGTSMATPQAAGLAAFMWSVNPDLSVSELHDIILDTAHWSTAMENRASSCNPDHGEPVIDALAAVLAAGGDDVRVAILDVSESGSFDEADLAVFADEFEAADDEVVYSRFDLSGDGVTGSGTDGSMRFDLDDSRNYGIVQQSVARPTGPATTMDYIEDNVSDWDVLCYYAYSELYEGDTSERDELIAARCSGAVVEVTVTDSTGTPMEGLPMEVTRDGEFTIHDIEDLGDGDYRIWVRESEDDYDIGVPSDYSISGDTSIDSPQRYEIIDDRHIQLDSAPDPSITVVRPSDGRTFHAADDVTVAVDVNTPSDTAGVEVIVGGQVFDSIDIDEQGMHELELVAADICPLGTVEITVAYEDGFGNSDSDSVEVEVVEAPLSVEIDGAGSIEIAWEDAEFIGGDPHWYVPDQTLQGMAHKPTCDDPQSGYLDQSELTWWKPDPWEGEVIESGPTLEVEDSFFRDGGDHVARDVGLSFEYENEVDQITTSLTPCYGELHIIHDLTDGPTGFTFDTVVGSSNMKYPEGPIPEASYPPCVTHESTRTGIMDDYYEMLAEFERIQTALEAEALLGELFDDLLTELDPSPPFPMDPWHLSEIGMTTWDDDLAEYVFHGLGAALYDTTLAGFQEEVGSMLGDAQDDLSDEDFAFLMLLTEEVSYYATVFNSVEEGGHNAWTHFGFALEPEYLIADGRVDPFAPARGAFGAYVETAFITADYDNYPEADFDSSVNAGMYGALSVAIDEASPPDP